MREPNDHPYSPSVRVDVLEPIVAYGARMSWAGLLRPGDEFCPSVRSRRATLTSRSGTPLRRFYGTWSDRYRRFAMNLSSARIMVHSSNPEEPPGDGIQCILHWVKRGDMLRIGPGGVCSGDGWPVELWERFNARLDRLPAGSVCEKLLAYAASDLDSNVCVVAGWRSRLLDNRASGSQDAEQIGEGWIPVPARLESPYQATTCIVSWSPSTLEFRSLQEALDSREGAGRQVDLANQAAYYLECVLAEMHGVSFGPLDAIRDHSFERSPPVEALSDLYRQLERQRIGDPSRGRLDRFG